MYDLLESDENDCATPAWSWFKVHF